MSDEAAVWDCIVVGAGAAGLSAALVLGRARRRTLLVDAGGQSNLAAAGIGGLLGQDGTPPAVFYAAGRAELAAYPSVEIRDGEVVGGARTDCGFELELGDGGRERARLVLLATGMDYRYPDLLGIERHWGGAVFHCPFCHGWEVRNKTLGVVGDDAGAVHRALLLGSWSDDVTLLTNGSAIDGEQSERLAAAGIGVDERPLSHLDDEPGTLAGVVFEDGSERQLQGLLVPVTLHQRGNLATQLGAELADRSPLSNEVVGVDQKFATSVPGLFAAGDLTIHLPPSVAASVSAGSMAAAAIVGSLTGAA